MKNLVFISISLLLIMLGCSKDKSVVTNNQAQIQADEDALTNLQEDYAFARVYNDSLIYCLDKTHHLYDHRYYYDDMYHYNDSLFNIHHGIYNNNYHFMGYCDSLYDYMIQHPNIMGQMRSGNMMGGNMGSNFSWQQHQGYNSDGSDLFESCVNMMDELHQQHQHYHPN